MNCYLMKFLHNLMKFTLIPLVFAVLGFVSCKTKNSDQYKTAKNPPLVLKNCELEIPLVKSPERIVVIGQHTTEILLSLGLKSNIIGWSFPDNNPLPEVNQISSGYPSKEVFFSLSPDFIYSSYKGAFQTNRLGDRDYLLAKGIPSYLSTYRCDDSTLVSFENIYGELRDLGKIFDREEAADSVVEVMRSKVASITANTQQSNLPTVWVFGGSYAQGTLLTMGAKDFSTTLIQMAGGRNIFEDVDAQGFETNVEEVIARDPDIIIIKETINNVNGKRSKDFLLQNPNLAQISAIRNRRFLVLTFTSMMPGVKSIVALDKMVDFFAE